MTTVVLGGRLTVLWKDPPRQGQGVWLERLKPLMRRPGQWALVYETKSARTAHNVRSDLKARRYRMPDGVWEFKARKTAEGGEVYARYVGKEDATALPVA